MPESMADRHVIVISEDALVYEDMETLRRLPVFGSIWPQAARVLKMRSVYPTVTYPAHTSMRTGVYPDKHGIVSNELDTLCERSSKWTFFQDAVKTPDIFTLAKRNGFSTASVNWPVTGRHPDIDYLMNEYWPQTADESIQACFLDSGSSEDVVRRIVEPYLWLHAPRLHPESDAYVHACAAAMIREYKPNLLMIHAGNIDGYRHDSGLFSDKVTHSLHECDLWLGWIIKAAKEAGIYDNTDFFILSDHGQLNITRVIALNVLLARAGLIQTDADGNIVDFTAFSKSTGMSAQIYLKHPDDSGAWRETYDALERLCEDAAWGVSRVYTADEARREERLAGGFSFVAETDGYTTFSNDWTGSPVRSFDTSDYRFGKATHGYQPDKGPQPTFLAFGPHIKPGVVIEHGAIVDHAPTIAKALGLEMAEVDGRAIDEIFHEIIL